MNSLEKVLSVVSRETGVGELTAETSIDSLGIDSLEFVSLLLEIEKELGKNSDDEKVSGVETIGDLIKAFA
jgi:acyl carrier protein